MCIRDSINAEYGGLLTQETIPSSVFSIQLGDAVKDVHFSDVELKLDNYVIPAHKVILYARSEFFRTIFDSSFKEREEKQIPLMEINLSIFEDILKYIYTNLSSVDAESIVDLLMASDRFLLEDLKRRIEKDLEEAFSLENIVDILMISEQSSSPRLKRACIEFIAQRLDAFKRLEGFNRLSKEAPQILRQIDYLNSKRLNAKPGSTFKKETTNVLVTENVVN
eukprot:TRINITY_DN1914_c0_g1_i1.p1 TRINITY_DN1914_c0_g1~~TRINITY_DN1914_c0_g1_i1.p1  ORF type:complete len:223 (-),score=44.20 TRINITY_DN1914_c0_g1_i1:7-675(-)